MLDKLEKLINSDIDLYEIAYKSDVSARLIEAIRNKTVELNSLTLREALKLIGYIDEIEPERAYKGYKPKYLKLLDFRHDNEETGESWHLGCIDSNWDLTVEESLEIMEIDDVEEYFDAIWGWKGFKYEYLKVVPISLEDFYKL